MDLLNKKPNKYNYIKRLINTKVDKHKNIPFGFTSSIDENGRKKIYTYGKRDIEKNLPFDKNSIYKIASQSKFMGVVGFLKLIDRGIISFDTPIKNYISEYSSDYMGVINPVCVDKERSTQIVNPLHIKINTNIIQVRHPNHNFKENQLVSLEWNNGSLGNSEISLPKVNGVDGFIIYNIHSITNITTNSYDIILDEKYKFNKTGVTGGIINIIPVDKNVKRSVNFYPDKLMTNPKIDTYYYKLEPLKREITILDVLNHGLGWSYYSWCFLYMSFGYSKDMIKNKIHAGVWNELGIPVGLPVDCYKDNIQEWVKTAAKVPLLYQPGEDWSYGPQLSVLGSLIELITGKSVEQYMKEELWEPLGMNDTGFFISDDDPTKDDKLDRLCQLYVNMPKLVMKFVLGGEIPYPPIYEAQSCIYQGTRSLCLIDCGMFTTVNDYLKFMKMFLNEGKSPQNQQILSKNMINIISSYRVPYDVSNLTSISKHTSSMSLPMISDYSEVTRKKILTKIHWGLGVGTIKGCSHHTPQESEHKLAITWAGVLGTRFLIDFCSKTAYNVGTNVIGSPAGIFDSDLIELSYKNMTDKEYKYILYDMLL